MTWIREHKMEALIILVIIGLLALVALGSTGDCSHGHHQGICGRQYKTWSNKVQVKKTCECVKDHY